MASTEGKVILPKQRVNTRRARGIPGYRGTNIDIVDEHGKVVGHGTTKADRESTSDKKSGSKS